MPVLLTFGLLIGACSASATATPPSTGGPSPSPGASQVSPAPVPSGGLTQAQLRVRLIERFGPLWYCDPDFYPVARDDEAAVAVQRWSEVAADAETLAAIEAQLGIPAGREPTDQQKLAIYHEWKMLRAIALDPAGTGRWRFDYLAQPSSAGGQQGTRWQGGIDAAGSITIETSGPAGRPNCPICLARGSLIETPTGPIAVEALGMGDAIWTLDASGDRVAGMVIALGSVAAPVGHQVVHLTLADGRSVTASPGHPLADGRRLGKLAVGDLVDGAPVAGTALQPYAGGQTFDVLPSGPTGDYAIDGVWLASTLGP